MSPRNGIAPSSSVQWPTVEAGPEGQPLARGRGRSTFSSFSMRPQIRSAFLLLMLGGCSGAELSEPPMPAPSRDERLEDDVAPAASTEAATSDSPPVAVLRLPEEGAQFRPGSSITFEGRGTDAEDGGLPASAYTWSVDLHEADRVSPFFPPISGMARGSFTVPAMEETEQPRWYRIHLQVKDSRGHTHETFRDVYAAKDDAPRLR
jgi:hypothetical protein